jgi:AcrR family transcriptional regulator
MPKALSEQETEAFRERICQVAARLFVEEGPGAVSMRRIAAELGCGTMTAYRYFASKEQIITAVRTRGCGCAMPTSPSPATTRPPTG